MGTTYSLYEDDRFCFELDEMSNTLTLSADDGDRGIRSKRLAPEQIINIALEMLKVCSYWTEEGTVEKAIADFKSKGYHW